MHMQAQARDTISTHVHSERFSLKWKIRKFTLHYVFDVHACAIAFAFAFVSQV